MTPSPNSMIARPPEKELDVAEVITRLAMAEHQSAVRSLISKGYVIAIIDADRLRYIPTDKATDEQKQRAVTGLALLKAQADAVERGIASARKEIAQ